ncbi:helix-turn-helix transcriptional regulator [Corynebacterium bovis]|uniref:helix-turn-helix domain-containing protein n=1 Tax=Corynebacterium bovis TaxID=36808 RepID=UPI00313969F6
MAAENRRGVRRTSAPASASAPANPMGAFLQAHRARLTPDDVGLVAYGPRRVPGLRREELAQLAGISLTYYTRLEQGRAANVSGAIINALARSLRLDEDATIYLHSLAGTTGEAPRPTVSTAPGDDPPFEDVVSLMPGAAVLAMSRTNDVLAYNHLAGRIFFPHIDEGVTPNTHRLLFTDPYTRDLYSDWTWEAKLAVASLRFMSGNSPDDPDIRRLVGELSMLSREFARLWADHPVARCTRGRKTLILPEWGTVELDYHVLHSPVDDGRRLLVHTARPGTPGYDALQMLREER